jgi:GYF domain 2
MNDVKIACPHCNKDFAVAEKLCGTIVNCPACGVQVPTLPRSPLQKGRSSSAYMIIGGDGQQYGPVPPDQLRQWMNEGRVNAATRVQVEGAGDWKPLGELPEFAGMPVAQSQGQLQPPTISGTTGATPSPTHQLTTFPVAVAILLHYLTFGLFTLVWLNLMHGRMCRVRADDPSAARAIGFCFIPFFNLYWIFFTYNRLCKRVDEQRGLYGLPASNLNGLAIAMCIFQLIPYLSVLVGYLLLGPIFIGMMQASINQLARTSATTAPQNTLPVSTVPAPGMHGCLIALIVFVCIIPVLGILSAIAIPNFIKAREISQRNACYNNLRQIEMWKDQATLANGYPKGKKFTEEDLSPYLSKGVSGLRCPRGGKYTLNPIGEEPVCSEHGSWEDDSRVRRAREGR